MFCGGWKLGENPVKSLAGVCRMTLEDVGSYIWIVVLVLRET
jgi:hypothetical protein